MISSNKQRLYYKKYRVTIKKYRRLQKKIMRQEKKWLEPQKITGLKKEKHGLKDGINLKLQGEEFGGNLGGMFKRVGSIVHKAYSPLRVI